MTLKQLLETNNVSITSEQLEKLNTLREIVLIENKNFNLTSITKEEEFNVKHILDSMKLLEYDIDNKKVIDVGTGAGFPGLVLAIMLPNSKFTLLDSAAKKITFINKTIEELKLSNVETVTSRAEIHTEKYDVVITRAVAPLQILSEICLNLADTQLHMKGPNIDEELPANAKDFSLKLGVEISDINRYNLIDFGRTIATIKTISKPSKGYPRIYSQIVKESK
ncbi:MAG: 16S rRNA (guanine(527)-N(7))-methyltransferase RsmG [Tenericutes bacterium]|nr:MAG: 16S rRNA (guanine(527)-N(7))-methyltransferase RsmG [Mycoplasmatota bacterium]